MISRITFLVEHGETTDPITALIDDAFFIKGCSVLDYQLEVDVVE